MGTNPIHQRAMLFTPPMITKPTSVANTKPVIVLVVSVSIQFCITNDRFSLMAFACTVLPMPNDATAANTQNSTPNHFMPSPFCRAYIGPPSILPSFVFTRYLMASRPSPYFVAMPNTPVSQHHSTAPGPPRLTAVATPMMLPVPIVAANDVANAPNWLTSPVASLSLFTDSRIAVKIFLCGNFSLNVRKICVPNNRIIIGHPQTTPLMSSAI